MKKERDFTLHRQRKGYKEVQIQGTSNAKHLHAAGFDIQTIVNIAFCSTAKLCGGQKLALKTLQISTLYSSAAYENLRTADSVWLTVYSLKQQTGGLCKSKMPL